MTASVAGQMASSKVKSVFQNKEKGDANRSRAYEKAGERIASTLGELKGAVMKVGQMASAASDLLPEELANALTQLQREAPPMEFSVIAKQIEQELGKTPDKLFASIEKEAYASASIGQVHRARTLDGREVVVKVQYPGVEDAVDSDLAQLRFALKSSGLLMLPKKAVNESFAEIRERLYEELNYRQELETLHRFREMLVPLKFIVVPRPVEKLSSKRVLTLLEESGDRLGELDEKGYGQENKNQFAERLFEFLCFQIFELNQFHADPHPGNFAFRKDGKIVVYDFGCTKRLEASTVEIYKKFLRAGFLEEYEKFEGLLCDLKVRTRDQKPIESSYYKMWRDIFARPLLQKEPYDFGSSSINEEAIALALKPANLKYINAFHPATELIFLNRTIVGHYSNYCALKACFSPYPVLAHRLGL